MTEALSISATMSLLCICMCYSLHVLLNYKTPFCSVALRYQRIILKPVRTKRAPEPVRLGSQIPTYMIRWRFVKSFDLFLYLTLWFSMKSEKLDAIKTRYVGMPHHTRVQQYVRHLVSTECVKICWMGSCSALTLLCFIVLQQDHAVT